MPTHNAESQPPPPEPVEPLKSWEHIGVFNAVKETVCAIPSRFKSELVVSGVLATDLFAFNSSLAATIEDQFVEALNALRAIWDSEGKYGLYSFERQPQTFPDVVLKTEAPGVDPPVVMGVELKGWYVLAKEKEPSFRYKVTPSVCAPADLLVVIPWALSNVISGSPRVFNPYVIGARYAAEYGNWYWQYKKEGPSDKSINLSEAISHYPNKSEKIADSPKSDGGQNFGRFARTGKMDSYIEDLFEERLAGIPLWAWQRFLAQFNERWTSDKVNLALDRLDREIKKKKMNSPNDEEFNRFSNNILELYEILSEQKEMTTVSISYLIIFSYSEKRCHLC